MLSSLIIESMDNMLATIVCVIFISCYSVLYSFGRDTISVNSSLVDGETIVSSEERFELGFFTPNGSSDIGRYVGIWYYKLNPRTVVWVANRDFPLPETGGSFAVENGYLKVLDKNGKIYWSERSHKYWDAKLLDSGNLVLRNHQEKILWQSFENPTDTFVLGMKMDRNLTLASWTSRIEPKSGNFTFKLDEEENQFIIQRDHYIPYWKSGTSGEFFLSDDIRIDPEVYSLFNLSARAPSDYDNSRIVMNYTGEIQYWSLDRYQNVWSLIWWQPRDRCSVLDACGSFGSCNNNNKFSCKCLPGFRPKIETDWNNREFSSGCIRNSTAGENDTFLNLKNMKVGNTETRFPVKNDLECKIGCLNDKQCVAYSYIEGGKVTRRDGAANNFTCWIWREDLKNLQEEYSYGGHSLSVRVATSDLESTTRNCEPCGTNLIPYPLSTGLDCGDSAYFSFRCDKSTGKLSFKTPTDTYNVTSINPTNRTFFIQLKETKNRLDRNDRTSQLIESLLPPFNFIKMTCGSDADMESLSSDIKLEGINEIEINWAPPLEPGCTSSADCKDWPYSTCDVSGDGTKRCVCNANFKWDDSEQNCTGGEAPGYNKQFGVGGHSRRKAPLFLILGLTIASVIIVSCVIAYIYRITISKRRERRENNERNAALLYGTEKRVKDLIGGSEEFKEEDKKGIEVPYFDLDSILAATDDFSDANKLGRGGFGPVYKGVFPGGQEIAIKRLSSVSGQGLVEFKNEVVLIARLQHRNLVRLLGYCIKGDEKILLYEYMPNKSLDFFIFDQKLGILLNWEVRFSIILGVARGLQYLHQDSRLRVIHRDLKTSNILLDGEMNPKISDFGLARIFEGKQTEGNTNRVVGTYGYMSPEYALDGLFSVKSDAFSFGVVVLEILSGRRSTGVFKPEQGLNLLSYAWRLWREDKALDFMNETLSGNCNNNEFMRCLHVALLCVQEEPDDRPTMSNAVVMLSSESTTLPTPKQPAFVERRGFSGTASSSSKQEISTIITTTLEGGR